MPATPVFISDLDTVKARLRLSAVDTGDAAAVLDSCVEQVRLGLYDELGSSLVTELSALTPGDPATTDDELRRLRAENVELLWIRYLMMERLPVLFFQSAGQGRRAWNEEGITRESAGGETKRALRALKNQVRQGLAALKGEDTGDLAVTVPVPDETPQRPGDSIKPATVQGGVL